MVCWQRNKESGFTIVELLVVIVIVAILATLTVSAYGGVSDRAQASKAMAVANAYVKILNMYYADHDQFPSTLGGAPLSTGSVCLGNVSDYPAADGFGNGECLYNYNDANFKVSAYQPFNDQLKPYATALPNGQIARADDGSEPRRGIRYDQWSSSPYNGKFVQLVWGLKGNHIDWCGPAGQGSYSGYGVTWCILTLDMR